MRLLLVLALLLSASVVARAAEHPTRKAARMRAMEDIQRVAVKAGMPTGLFGVKWLMTPKEVMEQRPNVKLSADGKYLELRDCYGKNALISYHFSERDDVLMMVLVSYIGESTEEEYADVRRRLIKDFGAMPEPKATDRYLKSSSKKQGGVAIDHIYKKEGEVKISQVLIYRHN